jgi:signal transduction histidine kinase
VTAHWTRTALLPARTRWGLLAAMLLGYGIAFAVLGPSLGRTLRPLCVVVMVIGALLFGSRLGVRFAIGIGLANLALYALTGVFNRSPSELTSDLLSAGAGVAGALLVGQIRDLALQLRLEVTRREVAEASRAELTELLVHDLKTPLTTIIGGAQLLVEPDTSPELQQTALRSLRAAADELNRLVSNLLDVGPAEDGTLAVDRRELDLQALCHEVGQALEARLAQRQQELRVLEPTPCGSVKADSDLIRRVLLNLVDNAIKQSPRGSVISVELSGHPDRVELAVRDQGVGVPEGSEERIFEKYVRLGNHAPGSRGLGLTFCRLAAQAHGGKIWVERLTPQGSLFRVQLPRG